MREIRTSGLAGGGAEQSALPIPNDYHHRIVSIKWARCNSTHFEYHYAFSLHERPDPRKQREKPRSKPSYRPKIALEMSNMG